MAHQNINTENIISIWAETEAEVQDFISLFSKHLLFTIDNYFVAKRTAGKRDVGHAYIKGEYYPYDIKQNATIDKSVKAPAYVTDLVQWCSPDIIIATDKKALLSLEMTYHTLTFNNIAQRIPRQVRVASQKVPNIIFQKVGDSFTQGSSWFVKTFLKTSKIYQTPSLCLVFKEKDHENAKKTLIDLVNGAVCDRGLFDSTVNELLSTMSKLAEAYDENTLIFGKGGKPRKWLVVSKDTVSINIGVKDNCALTKKVGYGCQGDETSRRTFRKNLKLRPAGTKGCVWLSKGTGGMDPYPGLIKMAEILLCYDENGKRIRQSHTHFSCLPSNFWWFAKNKNEIYLKLVREFSDTLTYSDTYQ